ncbi:MAG: hypothetical protein ACI805_000776, partial [Candidatus Azotimanducaceae bacterium]
SRSNHYLCRPAKVLTYALEVDREAAYANYKLNYLFSL